MHYVVSLNYFDCRSNVVVLTQLEADLSPAASVGSQADLDKERVDNAAERSSAGDEFEDMEDGGKGSNDITELDGKDGMEFGEEDPVIKQCEDPREHQSASCIPVRWLSNFPPFIFKSLNHEKRDNLLLFFLVA